MMTFIGSLLTNKSIRVASIILAASMLFSGNIFAAQRQMSNLFAATAALDSTANGTIQGHVKAAATNAALSGALVIATKGADVSLTETTAADGSYSYAAIPTGTYHVAVVASGFTSMSNNSVVVTTDTTTTVEFSLIAATPPTEVGSLSGFVRSSVNSAAIPQATVLLKQAGVIVNAAVSDQNGAYLFNNLAPGTYQALSFAANYHSSAEATVAIVANQTSTLNFILDPILPPTGSIQGTVTNAATALAISGAQVAIKQGATVVTTVTTNAVGTYLAANLAVGTYTLSVSATGFVSADIANVQVTADTTTTANIALQLTSIGDLHGTVTNATTTQAITGAQITVRLGENVVATVSTDADGKYSVIGLSGGTYAVQASASGFQSSTNNSVLIVVNLVTTADFALQPVVIPTGGTSSLEGKVVNATDGTPVMHAVALLKERVALPILADLTAELVKETTSDAAGNYSFTGLEPGIYRLKVSADGFKSAKIGGIVILANETSVVNVALRPEKEKEPQEDRRGNISGQVTDKETGKPVAGARVFFTPRRGNDHDHDHDDEDDRGNDHDKRFVETDANGRYTLSGLLIGEYEVHAMAKGFLPAKSKKVIVNTNATTAVNLALAPVPGRNQGDNGKKNSDDNKEKAAKANDHRDDGNKQDNKNKNERDHH